MLSRYVLFVLIIFCVLAEAYPQKSEGGAGSIGIGPQIGYQRAGDADAGKFMFGGFLRAKISDAFAVEGSINYRTEEYANGNINVRSWPVLVSALVYPVPMLYGIIGAGWYHTTFDFDPGFDEGDLNDKTQTKFGWHLGAGTEIPLSETVKLTGDIKYVFLDYDWEDLGSTALSDFNSNFYIINVGIAFGLR